LAASLNLSRTPVREALVLLVGEGLVQVFPKIGSFVARVDATRVADAQFLREAVELTSMKSLAEHPALDAVQTEALRGIVAAQKGLSQDEQEAFFHLDDEFHRGLLALAGHGGTWAAVAQAKAHLDRARMLGLRIVDTISELAEAHSQILEAVAAHHFTKAETLLRQHLRAVFSDIEAIRAASPELFVTDSDAVPVRRTIAVWE
jgi:DNA-binding GntR family transcriptional regulator